MASSALNNLAAPACVGIGLRQPHYKTVFETLPALDFVEVHAENFFSLSHVLGGAAAAVLEQARSNYPISLHGVGLSLGSAHGLDAAHLRAFADLIARTEPLLVSDHLCFGQADTKRSVIHANDLLPTRLTHESLAIFARNIHAAQEAFKRPMAVENISAYIQWRDADYSEVNFINRLAQQTGCGVLLDLNNLYVNALNSGDAGAADPLATCQQWVDALAVRPAEIHLAGFSESAGMVIDDHSSVVSDEVWQLYRHATQRFGCVPTLIEWDTALPEFEVLYGQAQQARAIQMTYLQGNQA